MEQSEVPIWKWVAAAISIIIICFFVGYFLLGPTAHPTETTAENPTRNNPAASRVTTVVPDVEVAEKTSQIQAQRKAEAEKRKKEQEEQERKRKEDELVQEKVAEAAKEAEAAAPIVTETKPSNTTPADNGADNPANVPNPDVKASDLEKPKTADPPGPPAASEKKSDTTEPKVVNPPGPPAANPDNTPRGTSRRQRDRSPVAGAETGATEPAPSEAAVPTRPQASNPSVLYRVVLAKPFKNTADASDIIKELGGRGYQTTWYKDNGGGGLRRLQLGAYSNPQNANDLVTELRANGYNVVVKRENKG